MKKSLLLALSLFVLALPNIVFGQQGRLTYEDANDIRVAQQYKNQERIYSYTTRNGDVIKAGDRLIFGSPVAEKITYMQGRRYSVFNLITIGTYADVVGFSLAGGGPTYVQAAHTGAEVTVEYLAVLHKSLNRRSPLLVYAFVRDEQYEILSGRTILDLEKALAVGEVINPNAPMTRQEAIAKLKETKDLVELGLVSESEFSKLRDELTPIIMNQRQGRSTRPSASPEKIKELKKAIEESQKRTKTRVEFKDDDPFDEE
jgi:hypothetical protein